MRSEKVAGEYRRAVVRSFEGRTTGTRYTDEAAPVGKRHPLHRHELVESRMRWKPHVRFGGRTGETYRMKVRRSAPARPYERHEALLNRAVVKGHCLQPIAVGC